MEDNKKLLRTLLLEDDPVQVMLVELELHQHLGTEIELTQVDSLADALSLLAEQRFDVALVDLNLTDSRGPVILTRLKEAAPSMPLVVCTGHETKDIYDECMAAGAVAILVKQRAYSHSIMDALRVAVS